MKITLPTDKALAAKLIDAQKEQQARKMEVGYLGHVFGEALNKPGNIAGFLIVVLVLLMGAILIFMQETPSLSKKDALTVVGGFISVTLGFVFGRTTSS